MAGTSTNKMDAPLEKYQRDGQYPRLDGFQRVCDSLAAYSQNFLPHDHFPLTISADFDYRYDKNLPIILSKFNIKRYLKKNKKILTVISNKIYKFCDSLDL